MTILPELYEFPLDDECYKVRLALSLMGVAYRSRPVDMIPGREHEQPAFLRINPRGTLPVWVDGPVVLREAATIILVRARGLKVGNWLPTDPVAFGAVMDWLVFSVRDLHAAHQARACALLGQDAPSPALRARARHGLNAMEDHMVLRHIEGHEWFADAMPTIADVLLFPAFALCRDYGLDHDGFPALRQWMRAMRTLPGFITMPGIPDVT
ncbi:glutathione S-transferase [Komagataeibacter kakiaceti JCM 25156]|uniref:glutathione S-transferase family protein n=1 Tax=Komagataeibacter kakiaceti TaxID=943261 RepID=UPI000471ED6D|nr:glutathione S-transferase family protein [Komagataeibacter kakiaceti]